MNTYQTAEIAKIIGIHPNTVRLYERLHFIPLATRKNNGYRIFTDFHIDQLHLVRTALQVEILQNGLRRKVRLIIKTTALQDFSNALVLTDQYLNQLYQEKVNANEALQISKEILQGYSHTNGLLLKRKQTSNYLNISVDTLRNWELNGLLDIKRMSNGYRVYDEADIKRLKVIRTLRCANYSLTSILRMLNALSYDPDINIKEIINMPNYDEEIITVCDKLLLSLEESINNAQLIKTMIKNMKERY